MGQVPGVLRGRAAKQSRRVNQQLNTILALWAQADARRDIDMIRSYSATYDLVIDFSNGRLTDKEYSKRIALIYARSVDRGYWDPSDKVRNSREWQYHSDSSSDDEEPLEEESNDEWEEV